jgi:hypothetical protein
MGSQLPLTHTALHTYYLGYLSLRMKPNFVEEHRVGVNLTTTEKLWPAILQEDAAKFDISRIICCKRDYMNSLSTWHSGISTGCR